MRNLIICETCQILYKPSNISYNPTTGNAIGVFSCSKCGHQIRFLVDNETMKSFKY